MVWKEDQEVAYGGLFGFEVESGDWPHKKVTELGNLPKPQIKNASEREKG